MSGSKENIQVAPKQNDKNEKLSSNVGKGEPNLVSTSNESSNAPFRQPMVATTTSGGSGVGVEYDEFSDEFAWTRDPPFKLWQKENPSVWGPLLNSLSSLDESLRCPICHDTFQIAVSLQNCKHSFCSECIRKCIKSGKQSMRRKAECPVCRQPCDEKHIISNWSLGETTQQWTKCRPHLWTKLASTNTQNTNIPSVSHTRKRKRTTSSNKNNSHMNHTSKKINVKNDEIDSDVTISEDEDDDSSDYVESPKRPLSQCTKSPTKRLPPKPTPYYHGMKRKKLVQLLKADGLPIYGNEKEMIQRHKEFITLYNAECDAKSPRPVQELVKEIYSRDKQRRDEIVQSFQNGTRSHSTHMENLKKCRTTLGNADKDDQNGSTVNNTSTIKLTSGNASFDSSIKEGFRRLLENAKSRGIAPKKTRNELTTTPKISNNNVNIYSNKNSSLPSPTMIPNPYKNISFASPTQGNSYNRMVTNAPIPNHDLIPQQNTLAPSIHPQNIPISSPPPSNQRNPYNLPIMSPASQLSGALPIHPRPPQKKTTILATGQTKRNKSNNKKQQNYMTATKTSTPKAWPCHKCTFINQKLHSKCEMCDTQRKKLTTTT